MTGNIYFSQASNGNSRGLSGDIGSSESWEFFGKSSTTGAGDLKIKLYTSSVSQMVPIAVEQWSGVTPQNQITLMDAFGNTSLNTLNVYKINVSVAGDPGITVGNTFISDSNISATNFTNTTFTGSKALVSNGKVISETTTTTTEINYLNGVSANIQTQINSLKQQSLSGLGTGTINRITKFVTTSSVGNSNISDDGSTVSITTPLSISGNVTATIFSGNLSGYKNVDFGNETTIANGFNSAPGDLYVNYRGATLPIKLYRFCHGLGATYSGILASAFIKNGGTSTQFLKADGSIDSNSYALNSSLGDYLPLSGGTLTRNLKISAYNEAWSEGIKIMVTSGMWGGLRLTRSSSIIDSEDNWAIGYANNNSGNLEFDVYTSGGQSKHTIFYKNGDVKHSGILSSPTLSASTLNLKNVLITQTNTPNTINIQGISSPDQVLLKFGIGTGYFGYNGSYNLFYTSGNFEPYDDDKFNLGSSSYRWKSLYVNTLYENGELLSLRYLPLSGGTLTRNLKISAYAEAWSEGVKVMAAPSTWGGLRLTRDNSNGDVEDNWAIGYANNNSGNLEFDVYTNSSQHKHSIFYKNGNVYHLGNISATELRLKNSANLTSGSSLDSIRIQGLNNTYSGYFIYGNDDATFGLNSNNWFEVNRTIKPTSTDFDLGDNSRYWSNVYSSRFIKPGGTSLQFLMADGSISYGDHLSSKFLPLSGGTMIGSIFGGGFNSGNTAMLTNAGDANLHTLRMDGLICPENAPTDINLVDDCYIGSKWYNDTLSKFYNSGKSNSFVVSDGINGGYGGIYFGSYYSNSYIGQRGDTENLYINGANIIEFSSTGLSLSGSPIEDYITYTAKYPVGSYLPTGHTYYSIDTAGDFYLPSPIKGKIVYVTLESPTTSYVKPDSSISIYYSNYSGTSKVCTSLNKLLLIRYRTIALMGVSSSEYSMIGSWSDPV